MRELKFRAWYPATKQMLYFAGKGMCKEYGTLTFDWVDENEQPIQPPWVTGEGKYLPEGVYDSESFELMQYTGLKDKNGKEIYEDDIVTTKFYPEPYLVEWNNEGWIADGSMHPELNCTGWCLPHDDQIEVIGNIYENPEILNENK